MIATDPGTITTTQGFGFSFWKPGLFQQGRREERKQKKDADLTTVYVLVWESVGSRGKNRAKPSCCYGLGFEARLNRQWREGRASGRGSGDRRRTAGARASRR